MKRSRAIPQSFLSLVHRIYNLLPFVARVSVRKPQDKKQQQRLQVLQFKCMESPPVIIG